jgi:lipoyl(octanoyl) transferase
MSAHVRDLGCRPYISVWREMQAYTESRDSGSPDEIWLVEHPPVYTLGLRADRSHVLDAGSIPVIATDRGGQVTYHGPGQLVAYVLLDLKRQGVTIRPLVEALERAVIDVLGEYGVAARARRDAPGVYVEANKIAALGLRVRRSCSYHGIALNVAMDLEPFARIHPCGYPGLGVTDLRTVAGVDDLNDVRRNFVPYLLARLAAAATPHAHEARQGLDRKLP